MKYNKSFENGIFDDCKKHLTGIMHRTGIKKAALLINKPPCVTGTMCRHNLNKILPPDSTLPVHFPDETEKRTTRQFISGNSKCGLS